MKVPHARQGVWPDRPASRFASRVHTEGAEGCRVALLGVPSDLGVRLTGGLAGAVDGPSAVRAALAGFGTPWDQGEQRELEVGVFDAGDVDLPDGDDEHALVEGHARVAAAASALHAAGLVTVGIGGGHDLTLPMVTGMASVLPAGSRVGGVNLGAHLGVRATPGSGMAFRRLIETGVLDPRGFVELGVGRFANARAHARWLTDVGGSIVLDEEVLAGRYTVHQALTRATSEPEAVFVSIDLAGLDSASAPGVSSVNPLGLTVAHAVELARLAGAHARVRHFDLMELCPRRDVEGRTARVAALLILSFLSGLQVRGRTPDSPDDEREA